MKKKASPYLSPMELLELFAKNNLPKNFCVVPFSNLIFNPNGDVGVCRQKGTEHVVGNITKQSVEEIWNSDYLKTWRHEFLTGDIKICKNEIANDACHLSPDNYTLFPEVSFSEEQDRPLLKLTANFNGQCNLKCTMCDIWMMQNGLYDEIGFWERAETEFFPHIKEVEMLSGEPFIQKDTYRLIDQISAVNPDVLWSFTTNGHWKLNKAIKEKLDKIKVKNIILSIDSLDPNLYSKIRKEGDLDVVLKNLMALKEYDQERRERGLSGLELSVHFLVMKNNLHELPALVDFVDKYDLRLTVNNCYEPKELSLWDYDPEREYAEAKRILNLCSDYQVFRLMRFFLSVANDLPGAFKAQLLTELRARQVAGKAQS